MPGRMEAVVDVAGYEVESIESEYPEASWKMTNKHKPGGRVNGDRVATRIRYVVRALERPDFQAGNPQAQRPRHEFVITEVLPNGSSKDLFRSCDIEDLTDIISTACVPVECEGDLIKKLLDGFTTTEIAEHVYGEQ